jgi:hypothetical protein
VDNALCWPHDSGNPNAAASEDGAERQEENAMESRNTPWTVTALAVGGLLVAGGLGGVMLDTEPATARTTQDQPAHVHFGGDAGSALIPIFAIADGALISEPADTTVAAENLLEQHAFENEMRRLWEDHIAWTRLYIVSAAADLPDTELTAQRLLRNQADIGDAIRPFYGDAAADELTTLLEEHILGAAELLTAAKSGDQTATEIATDNWYVNADQIGAFLSAANPDAWPRSEMQAEMRMHLDVTLQEATARLNGDFAADIAAYDEVHGHILAFADLLSDGIIQQFPDRFAD